ncbi:MAG: deoxyribonucleoside 5'-monophosphate N-glycosidase [Chlorobi bacterium]|nr:deoxyribonucleoside 5'-monophosphate N-glycosidase [Chlorobiota bacterium]
MSTKHPVYLAGSISAGRDFAGYLQYIADIVEEHGFYIISRSVLDPDADLSDRSMKNQRFIFERDIQWIAESAAMIAEISTPSLGVGFEVHEALDRRIPVLALRHTLLRDTTEPAMIVGNPDPLLRWSYYDESDLPEIIQAFLGEL